MGAPQALSPAASFAPSPAAPEIISPVVISGAGAAPQSVPSTMSLPVPAQDKTVVLGFAKSVPLAVALRQILPSGYAFSIDQDVDMGTLVSFQGGRAWRDTLRDSLDPVGLVAREQGQMIVVGFAGKGLVPPAASADTNVVPLASLPYQAGREPRSLTLAPPQPSPPSLPALPASSEVLFGNNGVAPVSVTESWTAERGENLRKVLEGWARRANVEFDWLSEYDYPLEASVAFSGTFENAVRGLLTGFEGAHPQPVAELHSNANLGQLVLVVQTRGNTNSD
jgi:hypothetical protein